jgi:hypothetical protein
MRESVASFCDDGIFCTLSTYLALSGLLMGFVLVAFSNMLIVARYFVQKNAASTDKSSAFEIASVTLQIGIWLTTVRTALNSAKNTAVQTLNTFTGALNPSNLMFYGGLLALTGFSILEHEYHSELLIVYDILWTFTRFIVLNFLSLVVLVVRLVVSSIIPAWNFFWRLYIQFMYGTYIIIIKCNVSHAVLALQYTFGFVQDVAAGSINWLTDDPTRSQLDLTSAIENLYQLLLIPREILSCVCEALDPLWELIFFYSSHIAPAINGALNMLICWLAASAGAFYTLLTSAAAGAPQLPSGIYNEVFQAQIDLMGNVSYIVDDVASHLVKLGLTILDKPIHFDQAPEIGLGQAVGKILITQALIQKGITNGLGKLMPGSICYNVDNCAFDEAGRSYADDENALGAVTTVNGTHCPSFRPDENGNPTIHRWDGVLVKGALAKRFCKEQCFHNVTAQFGCVKHYLNFEQAFTEMDRGAYFIGANLNYGAVVTFRLLYDKLVPAGRSLSAFDEPVPFQCGDFQDRLCWEGSHGYCDQGTSYCGYASDLETFGNCYECKDFSYVRDCETLTDPRAIKSCKTSCFLTCGCEAEGFSFCDLANVENGDDDDNGECHACPDKEIECYLSYNMSEYGTSDCVGQCFHKCGCDSAAISYCKEDKTCGQCREFYDKQETSCASANLKDYDNANCEKQCFAPCDCEFSEFCDFRMGNVGVCTNCTLPYPEEMSQEAAGALGLTIDTKMCYAKIRFGEPLKAAAIYNCDQVCQKSCGCERFGRTDGQFCKANIPEHLTTKCQSVEQSTRAPCNNTSMDTIVEDFTKTILGNSDFSLCDSCAVVEQDRTLCKKFSGGTWYGQKDCEDRCFRDPFASFADQVGSPKLVSWRKDELPWGNTLLELLVRAGGCTYVSTIRAGLNLAHIFYSLWTSLLLDWMLPMFFGTYEPVNHPILIIQRHEGQWYDYGANVTCDYRQKQVDKNNRPPSPMDYGYEDLYGQDTRLQAHTPYVKPDYSPYQYDDPEERNWDETESDWDESVWASVWLPGEYIKEKLLPDTLKHLLGNDQGASCEDDTGWPSHLCEECIAGYGRQSRANRNDHCHPCNLGYYQTGGVPSRRRTGNRGACKACPDGTVTLSEKSGSSSDCTSCPIGTWMSTTTGGNYYSGPVIKACKGCPRGWYQPVATKTNCQSCSTPSERRRSSSLAALLGSPVFSALSTERQASGCSALINIQKMLSTGAEVSVLATINEGSTSSDQCISIPEARLIRNIRTAESAIPQCVAGKYFEIAAGKCKGCPAGWINNGSGFLNVYDHNGATFGTEISADVCTKCPAGTWAGLSGTDYGHSTKTIDFKDGANTYTQALWRITPQAALQAECSKLNCAINHEPAYDWTDDVAGLKRFPTNYPDAASFQATVVAPSVTGGTAGCRACPTGRFQVQQMCKNNEKAYPARSPHKDGTNTVIWMPSVLQDCALGDAQACDHPNRASPNRLNSSKACATQNVQRVRMVGEGVNMAPNLPYCLQVSDEKGLNSDSYTAFTLGAGAAPTALLPKDKINAQSRQYPFVEWDYATSMGWKNPSPFDGIGKALDSANLNAEISAAAWASQNSQTGYCSTGSACPERIARAGQWCNIKRPDAGGITPSTKFHDAWTGLPRAVDHFYPSSSDYYDVVPYMGGTPRCISCPAGFQAAKSFVPAQAKGACVPCPDGTFSRQGFPECLACTGFNSDPNAKRECGVWKSYREVYGPKGIDPSNAHAAGMLAAQVDSDAVGITLYVKGSWSNVQQTTWAAGNADKDNCPTRIQSTLQKDMCVQCPAGWRKYDYYCRQCQPGRYTTWYNQAACVDCARGQYQPRWGQKECLACKGGPAGTRTGFKLAEAVTVRMVEGETVVPKGDPYICKGYNGILATLVTTQKGCQSPNETAIQTELTELDCTAAQIADNERLLDDAANVAFSEVKSLHTWSPVMGAVYVNSEGSECNPAKLGYAFNENLGRTDPTNTGIGIPNGGMIDLHNAPSGIIGCGDFRLDVCPTATYTDVVGMMRCKNCPIGYFGRAPGQSSCEKRTLPPTMEPTPRPTRQPTELGDTLSPTPSPTPPPAAPLQWFTGRFQAGKLNLEGQSSWITTETVFKVAATHVLYPTMDGADLNNLGDAQGEEQLAAGWKKFVSDRDGHGYGPRANPNIAQAGGYPGCEQNSDPFWEKQANKDNLGLPTTDTEAAHWAASSEDDNPSAYIWESSSYTSPKTQGKIMSPCETSMGYIYEATYSRAHGVLGYRGNYRLIVQCLTFNTTRFNIPTNLSAAAPWQQPGANQDGAQIGGAPCEAAKTCYTYYNAFNGAMVYVRDPDNFEETGGLGVSPGMRLGSIPGVSPVKPSNECKCGETCGTGANCGSATGFVATADCPVSGPTYFGGCTWRKVGVQQSPTAIYNDNSIFHPTTETGPGTFMNPYNPFPAPFDNYTCGGGLNSSDAFKLSQLGLSGGPVSTNCTGGAYTLFHRDACIVDLQKGMYVNDSLPITAVMNDPTGQVIGGVNLTAFTCSRRCAERTTSSGKQYQAFQWTFDATSIMSPYRCTCIDWPQTAYSYESFIDVATYRSPSCGIWAKEAVRYKFSDKVTVLAENHEHTATQCGDHCNYYNADGFVYEPRPFSAFVSITPVCSCLDLTNATKELYNGANLSTSEIWSEALDRNTFSPCSRIWTRDDDFVEAGPSQNCNVSSPFYKPFMEHTMNLNSHVFPQWEVAGQLLVNTIPSRTIGAFLEPLHAVWSGVMEYNRLNVRGGTTWLEAVYGPRPFIESSIIGDFGVRWTGDPYTDNSGVYHPDSSQVFCTFEEFTDGFTRKAINNATYPNQRCDTHVTCVPVSASFFSSESAVTCAGEKEACVGTVNCEDDLVCVNGYCAEPCKVDCTCVGTFPLVSITKDFKLDSFGPMNTNVSTFYSAEFQSKWCNSLILERAYLAEMQLGYSLQSLVDEVGGALSTLVDGPRHVCNASDIMDGSERKIKTAYGWILDYHKPLISGVDVSEPTYSTDGLSTLEVCTSALDRNLFCAMGLSVKYLTQVIVGAQRQISAAVIGVARLVIPYTEFTDRLCESQRLLHSAASVVVDFVPLELFFPSKPAEEWDAIRTGFGNVMFSGFDYFIEMAKVVNLVVWSIQAILSGDANILDILFQDMYVVVQVGVAWIANVFNSAADFMNGIYGGAGEFFASLGKMVKIIGLVVGKVAIQFMALIGKIWIEFFGLFTGAVSFGEFMSDLLLVVEKLMSLLIEGVLYMLLKLFKLDTNLGVMASLSTALNSLSGWIGAWVEQLVCAITGAIIDGIATVVGGLEDVITDALSFFVDLDLHWSDEIRAMIADGCMTRSHCQAHPYYDIGVNFGPDGLRNVEGYQKISTAIWPNGVEPAAPGEFDTKGAGVMWACGAKSPNGFAFLFKEFRVLAYDRYAKLVQLRYAKRYKICVEGTSKKYGFDDDDLTCNDVQRCVNTPDEDWIGLDGDAPDSKYWGDIEYAEIAETDGTQFYLPKSYYRSSTTVGVADATDIIDAFFGAGCNSGLAYVDHDPENWCAEKWTYNFASKAWPMYMPRNRKRETNIKNMVLMDTYCPTEPLLEFDCVGEGASRQCRRGSGCYRYINDDVLTDEVPGLEGALNVWSQPHDSSMPFLPSCISRCSMFMGDPDAGRTKISCSGDAECELTDYKFCVDGYCEKKVRWEEGVDGLEGNYAGTFGQKIFETGEYVPASNYSVGVLRLTAGKRDPTPVRDFCFCIPNPLVDKFWVEDANRCTINYHTSSGRNGKGIFTTPTDISLGTWNRWEKDEACVGPSTTDVSGYSDSDIMALNKINSLMPWSMERKYVSSGSSSAWGTYRMKPGCGFSYNDGGDSNGKSNQNKDYYMSIYKPRHINRNIQHNTVDGGHVERRRRLLSTNDYQPIETEPVNSTQSAIDYAWDEGSSRCEQIGRIYRILNWTNRTTTWLEEIEFHDCLTLRVYGETLADTLRLEDFPRDLFYNWQRKYILGLDFFYGSFIMANWAWNKQNISNYDVVTHISESLVHPSTFLSALELITGQWIDYSKVPPSEMNLGDEIYTAKVYDFNETVPETTDDIRMDVMYVANKIFNEVSKHDLQTEWDDMSHGFQLLRDGIVNYQGSAPDITPLTDAVGDAVGSFVRKSNHHEITYRLGLTTYVSDPGDEYDCNQFHSVLGFCTECALVDDSILDTFLAAYHMATYYERALPKVLVDFGVRVDSLIDPESNSAIHGAVQLGTQLSHKAHHHGRKAIHLRAAQRKAKRLHKQVKIHLRQVDANSTTPIDHSMDSIEEFARAVKCFVETTGDDPVPFFRHGLFYYLLWPFDKGCDMEVSIYTPAPNSETAKRVWEALGINTIYVVGIFYAMFKYPQIGTFLGGALPYVLGIPTAIFYLVWVYSYTPFCLPYLPHGLLDDFSYTLEEFLNSFGCLCRYLPDIVQECTAECSEIEIRNYDDCATLLQDDGFSELFVFWTPLLALQLLVPTLLPFVLFFWPFTYLLVWFPSIRNIMALDMNTLSSTQIQCAMINLTDFAGAGVIGGAVGYIAFYLFKNFNTLAQDLMLLGWWAIQIVLNAGIMIRSSKVPIYIQVVILAILVGIVLAISNMVFD